MKGFSFHPLAERELIEAARFYESSTEGLGRAFIDDVEALVLQIVEHPESGLRVRGTVRRRTLQRFPYGILYYLSSESVRILAVMNQKRRPDYWVGRT